jgi:SAM-dependent methyltransferase
MLWDRYIKKIEQAPELGRIVIITPTHNRKDLLEQTIKSVIAQTYTNYEYYILDDASTDGTDKMVKKYLKDNPNIHYIYIKEKSNPIMLNEFGCRIAMRRGEFWTRISSDDLFLPDKLKTDIDFLNSHQEFGACYGPFDKIDFERNFICPGMEAYDIDPKKMRGIIQKRFIISWANICVRTSVLCRMLDKFKHFSHPEQINMEDWVFNAKLLTIAKVGWTGSKSMAQYRIHKDQGCCNPVVINRDTKLSEQLVKEICDLPSEVEIHEYLNDPEYNTHITIEVGAEAPIIMGEVRNWQQSHMGQAMIPKDAKLGLDLGCARGYWTKRINEEILTGGKCIGTDVCKEFIDRGRKEYGVDIRVGDYHRIEFPDGMFDFVYADNSIEHSPRPDLVLYEVNRVLKKNGVFILIIPPDKLGYPQFNNPYHIWKIDEGDIRKALEILGFHIEEFSILDLIAVGALPYNESTNLAYIIKSRKVK